MKNRNNIQVKTQIVSRKQLQYYILGVVYFVLGTAFLGGYVISWTITGIFFEYSLFVRIVYIFFVALCFVNICTISRHFFTDYIVGRFSMDEDGITMYTLTRTIHYDWSECVEFGFTRWTADGTFMPRAFNYFIYCSKVYISQYEAARLISGKYKDYNKHLLFQYSKPRFEEFITYIPEEWQEKLREQESRLHLTKREQRYNR